VTHLSGILTVIRADGSTKMLSANSEVQEDDRMTTTDETYAHVKVVDDRGATMRKGKETYGVVSRDGTRVGQWAALDFISLLPLLVIVGVVPLVVFLKATPVPTGYQQFWVASIDFDFFSFYKARITLVSASALLLIGFVSHGLGRLSVRNDVLFIPLGIYTFMVVSSTVLSEHLSVASWGFFERSEGMWVLLAYVVLLIGTYLFVRTARQVWLILTVGAVAVSVVCVLGVFQYFGLDFFSSMMGRRLVLPAQYGHLAPNLRFNFPPHIIYSTLYSPNNVASMMAMVFPLAFSCFALAGNWRIRAISGAQVGLSCITLVGSNGRAGWIAAPLALLLLFLLSPGRKNTWGWKSVVALLLVVAVGIGVLEQSSGGALSLRTKGMWTEFAGLLAESGGRDDGCKTVVPPGNAQSEEMTDLIIRYGKVASFRGYIWIRSLQMAGDTMLLGHGPDTFALYFPNADPYKACVSQMFFDKPHNLYLQMWLNLGGVAMLAFLAMMIMHTMNTRRALKMADKGSDLYMLAAGLYAGWAGYLIAGFFYDSAVHVAPVFWVVFGLGLAVNKLIHSDRSGISTRT